MVVHKEGDIIGSKNGSGVYQNIISIFPKHDIYIEPFLGSATIMKRKIPAKKNIGIEINPRILLKHHDAKDYKSYLGNGILFLQTAEPIINAIHPSLASILIYCDPPYPIETRKSQSKIYEYEMDSRDQKYFIEAVLRLNCNIVISSYKNDLYDGMLTTAGWNQYSFQTMTRGGKATETIYYNYSPDLDRHQYNYIGKDYRERAKIKGKLDRTVAKINRMPVVQKKALYNLLVKKIDFLVTEIVKF